MMWRAASIRIGRPAGTALAALLAASAPAGAQCAMCGSSAGAGDVGRGLSISVLFLLGTLLLVAGGLLIIMVRAARRDADRAPTDS